ncbi:DUF1186 domain-containing protein [Viscerimonas tarda]
MSKKNKKNTVKQQFLSPDNYIRTKARSLPIVECLITPEWQDCGECNIIVARQHTNGNYTFGCYLVDTYCLGIKESFYKFNTPGTDFEEIKEDYFEQLESVSYEEVHNIIYGAYAYAEELGFRPDKDFAVTQYILEEDSDAIPLIEYEFGYNGKPMLMVKTRAEYTRYAPTLEKSTGGDFDYFIDNEVDDDDEIDDDVLDKVPDEVSNELTKFFESLSDGEKEVFLEKMSDFQEKLKKSRSLPHTPYNYQYPNYPQSLDLTHKELNALFLPENNERLDKQLIDKILSLPRETLIKDLNNCILYEIGQNCRGISEKNDEDNSYGSLTHALWLLAELKAEESLPVVLEVLRQNEEFHHFFFGDMAMETLRPVLYQLGQNQLPVLHSFAKEPNLYIFLKIAVSSAVATIIYHTPERRAEVIEWYGNLLDFYYENITDTAYYDANFVGMMMSDLLDICAQELLPKIKELYETGLVDEMPCGPYSSVEKEMKENMLEHEGNYKIKSIYDFYGE